MSEQQSLPSTSPTFPVPNTLPRLFSRPDRLHDPLYVVTPVFNSPRFRTRWKIYEDFALRVERAGAILYTVELAFGNRDFAITTPDNPRHIQLRTSHEIWLKENAINIGVSSLPWDWKYVAWIDADVSFVRNDWADETRHMLQHYKVVQMWTEAHDLNPSYGLHAQHESLMHCLELGRDPARASKDGEYYYYADKVGGKYWWHPGYAWACRRETWDGIGGLVYEALLGAGGPHK